MNYGIRNQIRPEHGRQPDGYYDNRYPEMKYPYNRPLRTDVDLQYVPNMDHRVPRNEIQNPRDIGFEPIDRRPVQRDNREYEQRYINPVYNLMPEPMVAGNHNICGLGWFDGRF